MNFVKIGTTYILAKKITSFSVSFDCNKLKVSLNKEKHSFKLFKMSKEDLLISVIDKEKPKEILELEKPMEIELQGRILKGLVLLKDKKETTFDLNGVVFDLLEKHKESINKIEEIWENKFKTHK
ncbi:hypothetical protein B6S12_07690 [Helicobacter valdiviensis]|uniref:Uncharacterized protein n=1 Tax=Helicobacter valdiviensis TaxID=1458358 RepID=A0A2W6MT66_9HELI|nr:hypothetical protein [Helicobacter valdiviensis]PZT47735.1 hypothetical protein B6S12_07690 [Helicobacter valdiviensis]